MILFIIKKANRIFKKRNLHLVNNPPLLRRKFNRIARRLPMSDDVTTEKVVIGNVHAEWIRPSKMTTQGTILYFHGGGYVIGGVSTHRALVAQVALYCNCDAIVFDYRLAPEHPYPAAQEDSLALYEYVSQTVPSQKLVFIGDSAGGGLALSTMLKLRELGKPLPAAAVLFSPFADLTGSGKSVKEKAADDPVIESSLISLWAGWYAGGHPKTDPMISPVFADFQGFPPMLIQVGTDEVLYDDSVRVSERAKAVGVDVKLDVWKGLFHVWQAYYAWLPAARRALRLAGSFVKEKLG